ncbi:MlaE family ABC transporter permease [Candidatus Odyssella thessalonicensis]|uniref:MlaE family ABC transporter permease n=1 Tax=Candidatus Odyssella thessalonicensis TaxID=84647 RepID=UPI000225C213|nr:ABC transporter permease [Candidatus Odyssella thessalonicensis]
MIKNKQSHLQPQVQLITQDEQQTLVFSGAWQTLSLRGGLDSLSQLQERISAPLAVKICFEDGFSHDSAGAWVIAKFLKALNIDRDLSEHLPSPIKRWLDKSFDFPAEEKSSGAKAILEEIGKAAIETAETTRKIIEFLGQTLTHIYVTVIRKYGLRWATIAHFVDTVGIKAIPIISLISLLIGAVLAFQGVNQLARFGASSFTVDFLAVSLLREISVLLTSIVVAGRSGSSFAAQIGTMALNQEIDAIRMMGLNPFHVLVIPRVLAMVISLPLLVLLSILGGGIGGMIVVRSYVGLSYSEFWSSFQAAVSTTSFWTGMSKAPLFAIVIAIIGCYRGMQVKSSAESVGIMTTRAVVESIFMVIICDAIMSLFFTAMDW